MKVALQGNSKEQRLVFKQCRRTGMMKYNMNKLGSKNAVLLRERSTRSGEPKSRVVCDQCKGMFSRTWFYAHKKLCVGDNYVCIEPKSFPAAVYFSCDRVPEEFKHEVLSKFNQDQVGLLCQTDSMITMIGSKLYTKVKARVDKKTEVRRSVMSDMRRLAALYVHFQNVIEREHMSPASIRSTDCMQPQATVKDMFNRRNYEALAEACRTYTSRNDGDSTEKSGLMISLYYLILKAAKIVRVHYLTKEDSAAANTVAEFLEVLAYNKNDLIGGAIYANNKNRQTRLRRPQQMPQHEDLQALRTYTINRMKSILDDPYLQFTSTEFVELRDMVCCRMTLFNARRGGEAARLQLSNWNDARNKVWFDPSRIEAMSDAEKEVFGDSIVIYHTGKGIDHLVPIIVPPDCVAALEKLSDLSVRAACGVREDNVYLFPSTLQSDDHVSGSHAIRFTCEKAGVQNITATGMRHLTSTMYAALDIPETKRSSFYRHMGHSKAINENIYQAPLAETEVLEVGSILNQFGQFYVILDVSMEVN